MKHYKQKTAKSVSKRWNCAWHNRELQFRLQTVEIQIEVPTPEHLFFINMVEPEHIDGWEFTLWTGWNQQSHSQLKAKHIFRHSLQIRQKNYVKKHMTHSAQRQSSTYQSYIGAPLQLCARFWDYIVCLAVRNKYIGLQQESQVSYKLIYHIREQTDALFLAFTLLLHTICYCIMKFTKFHSTQMLTRSLKVGCSP